MLKSFYIIMHFSSGFLLFLLLIIYFLILLPHYAQFWFLFRNNWVYLFSVNKLIFNFFLWYVRSFLVSAPSFEAEKGEFHLKYVNSHHSVPQLPGEQLCALVESLEPLWASGPRGSCRGHWRKAVSCICDWAWVCASGEGRGHSRVICDLL